MSYDPKLLFEAATHLVKAAYIRPREDVLLIVEHEIKPDVVKAFTSALKQYDADLSVLYIEPTAWGGSKEPSEVLRGALCSADLAIGLITYPLLFTRTLATALLDHGTRYIEIPDMAIAECLTHESARWPLELGGMSIGVIADKFFKGHEFRMTDERGTDFRCHLPEGGEYLAMGKRTRTRPMCPGEYRLLPYGEVCFWPGETSRGVIYYDGFYGVGYSPDPIICEFEGGFCTKMEGGAKAKDLQNMFSRIKGYNHCCEVAVGVNPKARINLNSFTLLEAQRNAGVAHVALGTARIFAPPLGKPQFNPGVHADGTILKASVYVDGDPLIRDGVPMWLEDRELRETARKYGDPDVLLSYERKEYR